MTRKNLNPDQLGFFVQLVIQISKLIYVIFVNQLFINRDFCHKIKKIAIGCKFYVFCWHWKYIH